jgi:hypothetical protein
MKTCILTLVLACAVLFSLSQTITQAEYFIDNDQGIGKNTRLTVALASDSSFTFNVNLTGVTPGFHKLYIRIKASNNKWSLSARKTIEVFPSKGYPAIAKGEYFFDTDPGVGKARSIAISPADTAITKTFTASASGLTPGYHKLYIRTQDNTGRWSVSARRNIEVFPLQGYPVIAKAEYFFDTDPGVGKARGVTINPTDTAIIKTFTASVSGLILGYHKFYLRTQDSAGRWSITTRRNIEVFPSQGYPVIAKGEYFFDTDPGIGKAKIIIISPTDTAITKTFTASAGGLTPGYHKLYIRTQDSTGRWSISARRNIEVIQSLDTAKIIAAEYFFSSDQGFGKATAKAFTSPLANGTFTFNIPYSNIPSRADTLFVRVKDNMVKWSFTKLTHFSGAPSLAPVDDNKLLITDASKAASARFDASINPNPVTGNMLTLYLWHTKQATIQLAVYGMDSKKILVQQFEITGSARRQISTSNLPAGTYLLHLSDGKEVRIIKFIKE